MTHTYDELLYSMGTSTESDEQLDSVVMAQDVQILKGRIRSKGKGKAARDKTPPEDNSGGKKTVLNIS